MSNLKKQWVNNYLLGGEIIHLHLNICGYLSDIVFYIIIPLIKIIFFITLIFKVLAIYKHLKKSP